MKQTDEFTIKAPAFDRGASGQGALLAHPLDVLGDPQMTKAEKKALLASWASDVRAVKDAPTCRQLDCGAIVDVSEILQALRSLDDGEPKTPERHANPVPYLARRPYALLSRYRPKAARRRRTDDDDRPPPCPASAVPPGRKARTPVGVWGSRPEWA